MTDTNGNSLGTMKYYPYGSTRSGSVPTDGLFTGQKLDGTGLYYYGARYYDPTIGRFISPDILISHPSNPQTMNRYSYCLNNPVKYIDPSGHIVKIQGYDVRDLDYYASLSGSEYNRIVGNDAKLAAALCSDEYEAYSIYRKLDKETTLAAETMENANDYVVNIESDPSLRGTNKKSKLEISDEDTYTIQVNPEVYRKRDEYSPANGAGEILTWVQNDILQMTPSPGGTLEILGEFISEWFSVLFAFDAYFHRRYEEIPCYTPVFGGFYGEWYDRDKYYEDHKNDGYPRQ